MLHALITTDREEVSVSKLQDMMDVPARPSLAMSRSSSAGNKPNVMICNTFGLTHAVSY